jgi:hypothetical protein
MSKRALLVLFLVVGASGCSTGTSLTPGATLLSGLSEYHGDMQRFGSSPARGPERQRAGGTLKTIVTATVGASSEFYRLIDLDIRKREFIITMRENSVRADRMQEMKDELARMNDEIALLKQVIRKQLAGLPLHSDFEKRVEEAATRGLLNMALDDFSSNGQRDGAGTRSTQVGEFIVTDLGTYASVRAPEGQTFRCFIFGVAEDGAGIKCDPAALVGH